MTFVIQTTISHHSLTVSMLTIIISPTVPTPSSAFQRITMEKCALF